MTKYDLEYKGVTCIAVDWEAEPYKFVFKYKGFTIGYVQKRYISQSADTDHIRCVIEQFLEDYEEKYEMSGFGMAGFNPNEYAVGNKPYTTIEPNAKYQPKRSQKIKNKKKGKKRK